MRLLAASTTALLVAGSLAAPLAQGASEKIKDDLRPSASRIVYAVAGGLGTKWGIDKYHKLRRHFTSSAKLGGQQPPHEALAGQAQPALPLQVSQPLEHANEGPTSPMWRPKAQPPGLPLEPIRWPGYAETHLEHFTGVAPNDEDGWRLEKCIRDQVTARSQHRFAMVPIFFYDICRGEDYVNVHPNSKWKPLEQMEADRAVRSRRVVSSGSRSGAGAGASHSHSHSNPFALIQPAVRQLSRLGASAQRWALSAERSAARLEPAVRRLEPAALRLVHEG
ncbi:MAG: hypothetical protein M1826_002963 [Phylliscum demangeonii]|nr:MAG: hypothetical protein M1826_002963 [Phylliscum demangeonii]